MPKNEASERSGRPSWLGRTPLAVKLLLALLGALGSWIGAAWGLDIIGGKEAPPRAVRPTWDAIVVLGCRVGRDGSPSLAMRRRVGHAVTLFNEGRAPRMVMTGGRGEDEPDRKSVV